MFLGPGPWSRPPCLSRLPLLRTALIACCHHHQRMHATRCVPTLLAPLGASSQWPPPPNVAARSSRPPCCASHGAQVDRAAHLQVYNMAYAGCTSFGDNAEGCALSESFSTAFAAACAEAAASAIAELTLDECPCADADTLAEAYARETARIFATVEQVRSNCPCMCKLLLCTLAAALSAFRVVLVFCSVCRLLPHALSSLPPHLLAVRTCPCLRRNVLTTDVHSSGALEMRSTAGGVRRWWVPRRASMEASTLTSRPSPAAASRRRPPSRALPPWRAPGTAASAAPRRRSASVSYTHLTLPTTPYV